MPLSALSCCFAPPLRARITLGRSLTPVSTRLTVQSGQARVSEAVARGGEVPSTLFLSLFPLPLSPSSPTPTPGSGGIAHIRPSHRRLSGAPLPWWRSCARRLRSRPSDTVGTRSETCRLRLGRRAQRLAAHRSTRVTLRRTLTERARRLHGGSAPRRAKRTGTASRRRRRRTSGERPRSSISRHGADSSSTIASYRGRRRDGATRCSASGGSASSSGRGRVVSLGRLLSSDPQSLDAASSYVYPYASPTLQVRSAWRGAPRPATSPPSSESVAGLTMTA